MINVDNHIEKLEALKSYINYCIEDRCDAYFKMRLFEETGTIFYRHLPPLIKSFEQFYKVRQNNYHELHYFGR